MHILCLTAYFPPDVGSAAHLYYELGRTFVARGHRVSVVTGFPGYHAQGDLSAPPPPLVFPCRRRPPEGGKSSEGGR